MKKKNKPGQGRPFKSYKYNSLLNGKPCSIFQHKKELAAKRREDLMKERVICNVTKSRYEDDATLKCIATLREMEPKELIKEIMEGYISRVKCNIQD